MLRGGSCGGHGQDPGEEGGGRLSLIRRGSLIFILLRLYYFCYVNSFLWSKLLFAIYN